MNWFNLTGWETVVATAIACGTAVACTVLGGRVVVETTQLICQAVIHGCTTAGAACQEIANAISDAIVAMFSGKIK